MKCKFCGKRNGLMYAGTCLVETPFDFVGITKISEDRPICEECFIKDRYKTEDTKEIIVLCGKKI